MARRTWMKREQWLIWIAAAIVLTFVLAAIGYLAGTKTAIFSGPLMLTLRRAISAE
jgi:nicotinamide riboside transporter PnuC